MQLFKMIDTDYDAALRQARAKYGPAIRMQSRRDFTRKGLFSTRHFCEICFYLVKEKDAQSGSGV
ncbi:MAG: hypothetical protein WCR02_00640 [Sphaerochaetaceae bacterium]